MTDGEPDGGVPLDITGHEDRNPPDGNDDGGPPRGDSETAAVGSDPDDGGDPDADGEMDEVLPDDVDADDDGEEDDEEVEPVELLVRMAKEGEIDPWDVDVVRVTDKFLDRLDGTDLRVSGRALFYASVLIRMKGDELLSDDDPEDADEPEPWEAPMAAGGDGELPDGDPIEELEAEMERRLDRKHARETPETLDELVRELREAERDSWWKESREYDTSDSPSGYSRGTQELDYRSADSFREESEPTEGDVTATTHEEDIEAVIDEVRADLQEHYDAGRAEVLYEEVADAGGSRVRTFLAVLFLSHRGEVRLQQDDLFGDLWIQDPNADVVSGEVAAD